MSKVHTRRPAGDRTPVTGGVHPSNRLLGAVHDSVTVPDGSLDKHIARLLAPHPGVNLKFRGVDLASMDTAAKRALLVSINRALGIDPFDKRSGLRKKAGNSR